MFKFYYLKYNCVTTCLKVFQRLFSEALYCNTKNYCQYAIQKGPRNKFWNNKRCK